MLYFLIYDILTETLSFRLLLPSFFILFNNIKLILIYILKIILLYFFNEFYKSNINLDYLIILNYYF
jgi:hypothetical protein